LLTHLLDRSFKVGRGDGPSKVAHPHALGRQIDSGFEHAGDFCERFSLRAVAAFSAT